jgi:DNA-directed RNA polymerase subunit M/transcription elongation factor TFIIS
MARSFDRGAPPGEVRAFGRACFLGAGLDPGLENEAYLSATILAQEVGWAFAYSRAISAISLRCEKRQLKAAAAAAAAAVNAESTESSKDTESSEDTDIAEGSESIELAESTEPAEPESPFDKIGVKLPRRFLESEVCRMVLAATAASAASADSADSAGNWHKSQIDQEQMYFDAFSESRGGELRAKTCALFDRALAAGEGFDDPGRRREISTEMERACFSETISQCLASEEDHRRDWESEAFRGIYAARAGVVLRAVDPFGPGHSATGGEARARLARGELTPDEFARLPSARLSPGVWAEIREDLETRANSKIEVVWSDEYRCPSCGQRQATVREQQKRAADEASTIKCTCICGFRFEA